MITPSSPRYLKLGLPHLEDAVIVNQQNSYLTDRKLPVIKIHQKIYADGKTCSSKDWNMPHIATQIVRG